MKMFIRLVQIILLISVIHGMLPEEKAQLRQQVIEMFKHAFGAYMVMICSREMSSIRFSFE